MSKQRAPVEFKSLGGGIITEASPLTFPDNASLDELNFDLSTDGIRSRRLGIDVEDNSTLYNTGFTYAEGSPSMVTSHLWENAGGNADRDIVVIQVDNTIHFYGTEASEISPNKNSYVYTVDYSEEDSDYDGELYGFSDLDGTLVVTTGLSDIIIFSVTQSGDDYEGGGTISIEARTDRLLIRDLQGVSTSYDLGEGGDENSVELLSGSYVTKRPDPSYLYSGSSTSGSVDVEGDRSENSSSGIVYWSDFDTTYLGGYKIKTMYYFETYRYLYLEFSSDTGSASFGGLYVTIGSSDSYEMEEYKTNKFRVKIDSDDSATVAATSSFSFAYVGSTSDGGTHTYNLRNQSFATKRYGKESSSSQDPISIFTNAYYSEEGELRYPSMADSISYAYYVNTDTDEVDNLTVRRFHAEDLIANQIGSYAAPKGYFIIDALKRSESRYEKWAQLIEDEGYDSSELVYLPSDETIGGAKTTASYGGRVWYGGFAESDTTVDKYALSLGSYVMYSQLTDDKAGIVNCYQEADPTSTDDPSIVDTDGGYLALDGAYDIKHMVSLGNSLVVFAANGVWAISGSDGNYFTPTTPRIQKITDKGVLSPRSIVVVDTVVMYWALDGIYLIKLDQTGAYEMQSLTDSTIKSLYNEIEYDSKVVATGLYDKYSSQVTWIYNNAVNEYEETCFLKLLLTTGAFTIHKVVNDDEHAIPCLVKTPPISYDLSNVPVYSDSEAIYTVEDGEDVLVYTTGSSSGVGTRETTYAIIVDDEGYANLTFGTFNNTGFSDWGVTDSPAYIVTGYVSGGDFQRYKTAPYITMHFIRTEDGFEEDAEGDFTPTNQSSCYLQAQWDWANSANSGRWSKNMQAYRYPRHYFADDASDDYDTGFKTINTKNKIRGKGRVLSLKLSTEEGKDCQIVGWSSILGVNGDV